VLAVHKQPALTGIFDGLTGFSRVAVAVSGGSDSMALLRLVLDWSRQMHGPKQVAALTVDHGLRAGSADEARQVAAWCKDLSVEHYVLPWLNQKPSTGVQAKARAMRYDLLSAWCRSKESYVLMTAHTAEDQAETVKMRLQRTTTDRSLASIWPENEWHGVKLLRPLLSERREALRDYLRNLGQGWLDDPSNENTAFERVRIRQSLDSADVVPLQRIAMEAQTRVVLLDQQRRDWLISNIVVDDYAVVRLPRRLLEHESPALQIDILSWALQMGGDGKVPERSGVEQAVHWLGRGQESRRSINGAVLSARRHMIEVMREPGRMSGRGVKVPESGCVIFDGRFEVMAPPGSEVLPVGQPALLKRPKDVPALAFAAIPAVKLASGEVVSAVKSQIAGISATLCERFRV
jgi:tRNA(Ile)-lysidine synthase